VQVGDVITKLNGADVPSSTALRDLLTKIAPGTQYDLVVRRGTAEQTLRVTATADTNAPTPAATSTKPGA
jgi:S1-C subfamily serine protease